MLGTGGFFARAGAVSGICLCILVYGAAARADCYELIGCTDGDYMRVQDLMTLSCENLWFVRNRIYDENGYCFKTPRALQSFDNADCTVPNQADVPLSPIERYNVQRIVGAESQLGCR